MLWEFTYQIKEILYIVFILLVLLFATGYILKFLGRDKISKPLITISAVGLVLVSVYVVAVMVAYFVSIYGG